MKVIKSGTVTSERIELRKSEPKLLLVVELEATNCWQRRAEFFRTGRSLSVMAWSLMRDNVARENGRALNRIFYLITR